ncbi:MAG: Lnb N-terminal periplasmic domain-containing protein, partial [Algiphilus sp.]
MRLPLFLLLLGLALFGRAHAEDGSLENTLATLKQRAEAAALWSLPDWQKMLHMEARPLGGTRSAVHSAWFFLAEDGRNNPRAELYATLRAFLENQTVPARDEKAGCVFGLRWRFLDAHLDLQAAGVPTPDCPRRAQWWQALNPERAWLVFPAAYLNSPASMFGHTLLRIDGTRGSETSPLLAYAVNFAAQTEAENSLVYAYKGLTGGYIGRFSVMPYYEKVREYGRIEVRDLWEYPLQLPEAALERVMLHLWELRGAGFDYYF